MLHSSFSPLLRSQVQLRQPPPAFSGRVLHPSMRKDRPPITASAFPFSIRRFLMLFSNFLVGFLRLCRCCCRFAVVGVRKVDRGLNNGGAEVRRAFAAPPIAGRRGLRRLPAQIGLRGCEYFVLVMMILLFVFFFVEIDQRRCS